MIRGYKCGLLLMVMLCWAPVAVADPAAGTVATPAVKTIPSPEEDYQAAQKAGKDEDLMEMGFLLRRAADRGHAQAQAEVAHLLIYGTAAKEGMEYYRKSADQGNADGQFGLGLEYAQGNPVTKQDYVEARKWIVLAADQGQRDAISLMAKSYVEGGLGLDEKARSGPETAKWIMRAADINDIPAIKALISAYQTGKYGLPVDQKKAGDMQAKLNNLLGVKVETTTVRKSSKHR